MVASVDNSIDAATLSVVKIEKSSGKLVIASSALSFSAFFGRTPVLLRYAMPWS